MRIAGPVSQCLSNVCKACLRPDGVQGVFPPSAKQTGSKVCNNFLVTLSVIHNRIALITIEYCLDKRSTSAGNSYDGAYSPVFGQLNRESADGGGSSVNDDGVRYFLAFLFASCGSGSSSTLKRRPAAVMAANGIVSASSKET